MILSPPGQVADKPAVAFDQRGDAVAVWEARNGASDGVRGIIQVLAAGSWVGPSSSSRARRARSPDPQVGIDAEAPR